jgi:hypothetical protein
MRRRAAFLLLILLFIACQVIPTPPSLKPTPLWWKTPDLTLSEATPGTSVTPSAVALSISPEPMEPTTGAPGGMLPFPAQAGREFAEIELGSWKPKAYAGVVDALPIHLGQVINQAVVVGLTNNQRSFLAQNGFVVIHSQEAQFSDIRERVSTRFGQPYYLTSDAAYHALHLTVDELLRVLEREELQPRMIAVTQSVLDEVLSYQTLVKSTSLLTDTHQAAAYLGVALRLFDPQATLEPGLEASVAAQVGQILAGRGVEESLLIPSFKDDYTAYQPVGHYAGDAQLEAYFRGMTWFGRVHFRLRSDDPGFLPSRAPLIITMALRQASTKSGSTVRDWAAVDDILTFLIGSSDDNGPREYARLMDQVYGPEATLLSLADETSWQLFLDLSQELPFMQIASPFAISFNKLPEERGWLFMGQRFNLDTFILQSLVFDRVGTQENKRELPSGLDVMAALGSQVAMSTLEKMGAPSYPHYSEQMTRLQEAAQAQPESQWLSSVYGSWMYAFMSQLAPKPDSYPPTMRTAAWTFKNLNSALGSWAELKHDTTLYVKMPEMAGGGGPPASGPAPAYVEPDPPVFYCLAYIAGAIADGLTQRVIAKSFASEGIDLQSLLSGMQDLADQFQQLGDIAVKELEGIPLEEDDRRLIQGPLGPADERVWYSQRMSLQGVGSLLEMPPPPAISAVAGSGERVLQAGVGQIDRIYVIVPLDGILQIAQGGVFSYYEFPQLRTERLTDEQWRQAVSASSLALPDWTANFLLPEGDPVDILAFRVGDVYRITQAGLELNVRESASRYAKGIQKLQPGDYVMIVDGPVQAEGFTWWKFSLNPYSESQVEGWAVENQAWYERAWGQ